MTIVERDVGFQHNLRFVIINMRLKKLIVSIIMEPERVFVELFARKLIEHFVSKNLLKHFKRLLIIAYFEAKYVVN